MICYPPVLALLRPNLLYFVNTDASAYGVVCTMFQTHEDRAGKPIWHLSRSLSDTERNYSSPKGEYPAIVWALQTLRLYLQYEKCTVFTDSHAPNCLLNIIEPSGWLTLWRLRLQNLISKSNTKRELTTITTKHFPVYWPDPDRTSRRRRHPGIPNLRWKRSRCLDVDNQFRSIDNRKRTRRRLLETGIQRNTSPIRHSWRPPGRITISQNHFGGIDLSPISRQILFRDLPSS